MRWLESPCTERSTEYDDLRYFVSPMGSDVVPFCWGPPCTGKSSTVRILLESEAVPHIIVDCAQEQSIDALLIQTLVALKVKAPAKRYIKEKFMGLLLSSELLNKEGHAFFIVLDKVERVAGSVELSMLLRARDYCGANISLIMISTVSPSSCMLEHRHSLIPIEFAAYSPSQLVQVLKRMRPEDADKAHFENMLLCVPDLARISNRLDDLKAVLAVLWPMYNAPIAAGHDAQDLDGLLTLFKLEYIKVRKGFMEDWVELMKAPVIKQQLTAAMLEDDLTSDDERLLLMAAFIASRVTQSWDAEYFCLKEKKRRVKVTAKGVWRHDARLDEFEAKGPQPVNRDRLRLWFRHLRSHLTTGSVEDVIVTKQQLKAWLKSLKKYGLITEVVTKSEIPRFNCCIDEEQACSLAKIWLKDGFRMWDYFPERRL